VDPWYCSLNLCSARKFLRPGRQSGKKFLLDRQLLAWAVELNFSLFLNWLIASKLVTIISLWRGTTIAKSSARIAPLNGW
jgi:hypothetical protein